MKAELSMETTKVKCARRRSGAGRALRWLWPPVLLLAVSPWVSAREPLFTIADPVGDDDGDGSLVYPMSGELAKGDLDLIELAAYREEGGTWFRATFARPIRKPERRAVDSTGRQLTSLARHGFYTFNLDLYIDQDRTPASGDIATLPGRKVEIAPRDAWEKVVVLSPVPFEGVEELERELVEAFRQRKLEQHESTDRRALREHRRRIAEELEPLVFFPREIRVSGPTVEFFVPEWFLGGSAEAGWGYAVLVTGARLERRAGLPVFERLQDAGLGLVMPVELGRPVDAFGGGRKGDDLQPPVVDILVPPGEDQHRILSAYDLVAGRPAQVPAVVPAEAGRDASGR